MKEIEYINKWFKDQCDGDWEHMYGIKIYTLDNPGWAVKIDLHETDLNVIFTPIEKNEGEEDWLSCKIINNTFTGYGGINNIQEILAIFCTHLLNE